MKTDKPTGQLIIITQHPTESIDETTGIPGTKMRAANKALGLREWSIDSRSIAAQLKSITENFHEEINSDIMETLGIEQIELSLTLTGKGKLAILGSGIEAGANASIKLIIGRRKEEA